MSFHNSCQNIHLIHEPGATFLHAEVRRANGEYVARKIRLDRHIGNTDGMPSPYFFFLSPILLLFFFFFRILDSKMCMVLILTVNDFDLV